MAISGARAVLQLTAVGTASRTNASGSVNLGMPRLETSFETADIAYSVTITATGATDQVTLNTQTGAITNTTGTPTITDGGVDFEGKALANVVTPYAIAFEVLEDSAGGVIGITSSNSQNPSQSLKKASIPMVAPLQHLSLISVVFAGIGDSVKITVIGKST